MDKDKILNNLNELTNNCNQEKLEQLFDYIFGFDNCNNPNVVNGEILYKALKLSKKFKNEAINNLIYNRIFKNSGERYNQIIKKYMVKISSQTFLMGSDENNALAYVGETPKHEVALDEFKISSIPITREMYAMFNPNVKNNNDNTKPMTNITWFDAYMFALWIGCRLPTESEWEYASGKNENKEWCCFENELTNYAWYSENSKGFIHDVKMLKPNKFGLYDMHGNIWEWTLDYYDDQFYENCCKNNPVNTKDNGFHVCKGGSIQSFSEMCRCSFRYYEPSDYEAIDLGFRVVKESKGSENRNG